LRIGKEYKMKISKTKVAIVGCGLVGASTGFSLLTQGVCDEILMIDINQEKALGEVLDMRDDVEYLNRNTKVMTGSYEDCGDADIVVITAGAPPKKGQSRLDTLDLSAKISKSIVEPIMAAGFDGIFIIISNPVDIIAHYVQKISGLPKNQVIGTGTSLDSARLKNFIAEIVHVDPRSVYAYSLGEHGDSQMVPWSLVTVGGKKFYDVVQDNPELMQGINLDDIVAKTIRAGWEIYDRKGTTSFGIATAAVGIIKAVLNDENKIIPVSTLLEGEFGQVDVYCGVPVILNRNGASDVLEIHMSDDEQEKFNKSAETIRNYTQGYFKEIGLL
jgi:L-lactate dehydrogenase